MIINDFNIMRIALAPTKTDPPLIINPNAVLASTFSGQRLKTIPGWNP